MLGTGGNSGNVYDFYPKPREPWTRVTFILISGTAISPLESEVYQGAYAHERTPLDFLIDQAGSRHLLQDGAKCYVHFDSGERGTQTEVNSETEGDVSVRVAA